MTFSSSKQRLRDFFKMLVSLILPKDASVLEIEAMSAEDLIRKIPHTPDTREKRFAALFAYKNRIMRAAIWEIKYWKNEIIAKTCRISRI